MLRLRAGESCLALASSSPRASPHRPSVGHWTMARVLGLFATHTGALARNLGAELSDGIGARQRGGPSARRIVPGEGQENAKHSSLPLRLSPCARGVLWQFPVPIGSPATPHRHATMRAQRRRPTRRFLGVSTSKIFRHASARDSTATRWPRRRRAHAHGRLVYRSDGEGRQALPLLARALHAARDHRSPVSTSPRSTVAPS